MNIVVSCPPIGHGYVILEINGNFGGTKESFKIALERYDEAMGPWFIAMVGLVLANSPLKNEISFNGL